MTKLSRLARNAVISRLQHVGKCSGSPAGSAGEQPHLQGGSGYRGAGRQRVAPDGGRRRRAPLQRRLREPQPCKGGQVGQPQLPPLLEAPVNSAPLIMRLASRGASLRRQRGSRRS